MYTKRLVGSVVSRACHVMTSSCVARGDSCLCLEVTQDLEVTQERGSLEENRRV